MILFQKQPVLKFQENSFWKFSEIKGNPYIIDYEKDVVMHVGVWVAVYLWIKISNWQLY